MQYPDRDWGSQKLHSDLPEGHFLLLPDTPSTAPSGYKKFDYQLGGHTKKFRLTQLPLIKVGHHAPTRTGWVNTPPPARRSLSCP